MRVRLEPDELQAHFRRNPSALEPPFPETFLIKGRLYVRRSEGNWYKVALMRAGAGGEPPPPYVPPASGDSFVVLKVFSAELGHSLRTSKRRIAEAKSRLAEAE